MIKWLRKIFLSENIKESKPVYIPKAGDKYYFTGINNKDPFPKKNHKDNPVTIIDYKEGWIRYQIGSSNSPFNDERIELLLFLNIYKKLY